MNTTVTVTLASGATTWEYSINSGSSWTAGSGQVLDAIRRNLCYKCSAIKKQ